MAGAVRGGYAVVPHVPPGQVLRQGFWVVRHWALPTGLPSPPGRIGFVAIGVLVGVVLARRGPSPSPPPPGPTGARPLPFVLATFMASYAAVVLASASLWAEQVPLDERTLFPAYAAGVALAACLAARAGESGRLLRTAVLAGVATVAIATAVGGIQLLRQGEVAHPGYAGEPWTTSDGLRQIARLPAGTLVYSDFPDAIHYRTARASRLLPRPLLPEGKPNPRYGQQMARLADEVANNRSVVIVFLHPGRDHVPGPPELADILGRPPDRLFSDSVMWGGAARS